MSEIEVKVARVGRPVSKIEVKATEVGQQGQPYVADQGAHFGGGMECEDQSVCLCLRAMKGREEVGAARYNDKQEISLVCNHGVQ